MKITKMHGLGNSQILVEDFEGSLEKKTGLTYNQIAKSVCNQNFGLGSDQMLVINSSEKGDFMMRVFNKDGGEAEMCGNGIRCVARYLYDKDLVGKKHDIETKAGVKHLNIISKDNIEVEMGKGNLLKDNLEVEGFEGSLISVGNPHFVIFTDKASRKLAEDYGSSLENASEFQPDRANIEFAKVKSESEIETYVWERGAGITLACGTGACATAFAAKKKGLVGHEISVKLLGGKLDLKIDDKDQIRMSGPAEYILEGEIFNISKIYSKIEKLERN